MSSFKPLLLAMLLGQMGSNPLLAQWIQTNGPSNASTNTLVVSGTNLLAGNDYGVFLSTDNGTSWSSVKAGLPPNVGVECLAVSDSNLFAGSYNGHGVFLSTNNGRSWIAVDSGLTSTDVWSLAFRPTGGGGTNLFAGTYLGGVFLSTNDGRSWTAINSGLTAYSYVFSLVVSGTKLFAGTDGGVFLSTNDGTSWAPTNSGFIFYKGLPIGVSCLAASPSESGDTEIFAGTDGWGIFRSSNSGTNWTQVSNGMTGEYVKALAFNGMNIFAGASGPSGGVFLSTNNGEGWNAVDEGLPTTYVSSLVVSDGVLFAGTQDRGIWKRPLSQMMTGLKTNVQGIPAGFILDSNFPNPFNPSTIISYQLPVSGHVTLRVYDVLGRLVRTLVDKRESAGNYSVTFSADGLASGVYFYRLQAEIYSRTRRLLVLR